MSGTTYDILVAVALTLLVVLNAGAVALVALQLPGTWVMLILTGLVAWWRWGEQTIGPWSLVALLVLALLGELLELVVGTCMARSKGGSKRGAAGAMTGSIFGAIIGTALMPVIGTILGASLGAGAGSMVGDRAAGRNWVTTLDAGSGAAFGRFFGTLGKLAVAIVMWIVVLIAIIV